MKKTQTQAAPKTSLASVDRHIELNSSAWSFSLEGLAEHFDDHIRRSIPSYTETSELILDLSDYYTRRGGMVYDLGCSTGDLTRKLAWKHKENENTFWCGLDKEKEMIAYAKKRSKDLNNLEFIHCDFLDYHFQKSPFFIIGYTLQFMKKSSRLTLLAKIYEALEEGGACLICEKTIEKTSSAQNLISSLYTKYKTKKGFSSEEILAKESSLRGVLTPLTQEENFRLFKMAHFEKITLLAKNLHFETYLLEK